MPDPEGSRKEWEKEIIDVQHSVTFPEELRSAQIIAKKLSSTPAPIPDFAHLVRLLLSGMFLVGAFLVFSSDISHKTALGIVALAAGCCLGVAAFRWHRKHG
ncbi:MAG: hypothetical protein WCF68_18720 [Terriglobales bacterium]